MQIQIIVKVNGGDMRVGILTSGGDAPGMNAAIRSCVRSLIDFKHDPIGIRRGYQGLIDKDFFDMNLRSVANIIHRGGTVLKTSRYEDFRKIAIRKQAANNLKEANIDRLIIIGGNGSYLGAKALYDEHGIISCGIPGTIDNDVSGTDETIGFDTALNTAIEAIDKIRDTANSHERLFLVEVMGRDCDDLPLAVALACGAEYPLIYKSAADLNKVHQKIKQGLKKGKKSSIIVVAENSKVDAIELLKKSLKNEKLDFRSCILGHIQRGGAPTAKDRILASRMGYAAAEHISELKKFSCVVSDSIDILVKTYEESQKIKRHNLHSYKRLNEILAK